MQRIIGVIFLVLITSISYGQGNLAKIETNKILCLFNFLETSSNQKRASSSYRKYILNQLGEDEKFNTLTNLYAKLNLTYATRRKEYPENRHVRLNTKDLIWIAASNAKSIDDLSERIIGYLPHSTHNQLIDIFKQIEPYYDSLTWEKEQENINRIEEQLSKYKGDIDYLYQKISGFYHTQWNTQVPFKVMLYPIPLKSGNTRAFTVGNALICGFLSRNENDYKGRLGVIIHEMCHILYEEQSPAFQHKLEKWFTSSDSPYSKLAYNYMNEALATALGNGWAYEQIHKKVDPTQWYNDKYIEGFARAIFPLVKMYLNKEKPIDEAFVKESISIFEITFPKAIYETKILMDDILLFTNTEIEKELDSIEKELHEHFKVRSMWFLIPIKSEKSIGSFSKQQTTKLFIVESDHAATIETLNKEFPQLKIETQMNAIDIFKDNQSKSTIIVMNVENITKIKKGLALIASLEYLDDNKSLKIE